jgi:hypothetical protein
MIIVLKIILGLLAIADILVLRYVAGDFKKVRKTEGYDNLSIWEKLRFTSVFYFLLTALVSLFVFLGYFIVVPLQIN